MKKYSRSYLIFSIVNYMIMCWVIFMTVYPLLYVFALSFSDSTAALSGKVSFYPIGFSDLAYRQILDQKPFWVGYRNTIFYTLTATTITVLMTSICAYPLSKKTLLGRKFFMAAIVFTMFFSGGIIPNFLLIKALQIDNTMLSIILPASINAYNMVVMRTFFQSIPDSIEEAAVIDGLNPIQILFRIVFPLSKAILATIALFAGVYYWNDWFYPLIYLNDSKLFPVTIFLRNVVMGTELSARTGTGIDKDSVHAVAVSVRSATIMLVVLPFLFIYPFVQKYFVKGLMIGSIKE